MIRKTLLLALTVCISSLLLLTRVLHAGGSSSSSASFKITFKPASVIDVVPPGKVTDLSAVPGENDGEVQLSWSMPGDDDLASTLPVGAMFRIQYSTAPDGTGAGKTGWHYTNAQIEQSTSGVSPTTLVSYVVTSLSPGVLYYFCIWHCDEAQNWSEMSNVAASQATLIDREPPDVAITLPLNNAFHNSLLTISGTASDNVAISTVQITIRDLSYSSTYWDGVQWVENEFWLGVNNYSSPSWLYTQVPEWASGTRYEIVACAKDTAGNWSSVYSTVTFTFDNTPPEFVGFISVSAISSTVIITTGTAQDTASGLAAEPYYIQMSTDGILWGNYDSGWVASYHTWTVLSPNTTYWFRIKAKDAAGNESVWSSAVAKVTLANPPARSYVVACSSWFVQIAWSENSNPSYTKWGILRSTDGFISSSIVIKDFSSNYTARSYTDYSVLPSATYWYKVCAYNEEGIPTEFDITISTRTLLPDMTPPAKVSDLAAHSTAVEGEVLLTWTFTGDDEYQNALASGFFIIQYSSSPYENIVWSTAAAQIAISTYNVLPGALQSYKLVLPAGSTYYFALWIVDDNYNISLRSNIASLHLLKIEPPYTPARFSGIALTTTTIKWFWTDNNPFEEGYRIITISTSSNAQLQQQQEEEVVLKTLPPDTTCWIEDGLSVNTSYYRVLEAYNYKGSARSSPAIVYTLANPPTGSYIVDCTTVGISLRWAANNNPVYTLYNIYRSTDGYNFSFLTSTSLPVDFYMDRYGLVSDTTYYYKIQALNGDKIPTAFDVVVSTYIPLVIDTLPPAAITDLSAETPLLDTERDIPEGYVRLRWSAPGDDDMIGMLLPGAMFKIQYSTAADNSDWSTANAQVTISTYGIQPQDVITYYLGGLFPGVSYYFAVWTIDEAGNAAVEKSNIAFAAAKDLPPGKVSGFKAEATGESGKILLSWEFNTEVDIKEYRIYRSTVSGAVTKGQPVKILNRTQNVWEDAGLVNHVTYYYRITAVDLSGKESALSEEVYSFPYSIVSITEIAGRVTQSDGQPLALVLCEAILLPQQQQQQENEEGRSATATSFLTEGALATTKGVVVKKVYTDIEGEYIFSGLSAGTTYVIRVTLAELNKQSIVFREVPSGTSKVNFTLEIRYKLGEIVGMLSGYNYNNYRRAAAMSQQQKTRYYRNLSELPTAATSRAAQQPYIEIYRLDYAERAPEVRLYVPVKPDGSYEIKNLLPGRYLVRAYNGVVYSEPVSVYLSEGEMKNITLSFPELPQQLVKAYPNPARTGEVNIEFYTTYTSPEATILIYDLAGQLVKKVSPEDIQPAHNNNNKPQGTYIYKWQCVNNNGRRVASGVYIYVLEVKDRDTQRTSKVVKKFAVIR